MKTHHVLLVPEDPQPLRELGTCGYTPPFAAGTSRGWFGGHETPPPICIRVETALVLAWDGVVLDQGLDVAAKLYGEPMYPTSRMVEHLLDHGTRSHFFASWVPTGFRIELVRADRSTIGVIGSLPRRHRYKSPVPPTPVQVASTPDGL